MNIGSNYQNIYAYANSYSQNTTATQSVSQNSFLAQLEKSQEISQTEQIEKKEYSKMTLEELNNLSYEEYKVHGKEISQRSREIREEAEANKVYTKEMYELDNSVWAKVALADYTYDDNTNKALMKSLEEYRGGDGSEFMLSLQFGVYDHISLEGKHSFNEDGTRKLDYLNPTKEQRSAALSIDGASNIVGYYEDSLKAGKDEFGDELSPHIKPGYDLWSSILENLVKQNSVKVYG